RAVGYIVACIYASYERTFTHTAQVEDDLVTQVLHNIDISVYDAVRRSFEEDRFHMDVFRTYAKDDFLAHIALIAYNIRTAFRQLNVDARSLEGDDTIGLFQTTVDEVHRRRS